MVPLDPPSPDLTYDRRRDKEGRMDRKRARYLRPLAPASAPISRFVLENILKESATAMAEFSNDFKRLILQSCLHYGMETFYQSWNCGYESQEGGLGEFNPKKRIPACRDPNQIGFFSIKGHWWENSEMDHHQQHFNSPACRHKANAECLKCGVLRCFKHIHLNLDGMYKSLCNYCFHIDTYSAQALCISRVTANLQPYTQEQLQRVFDRRFYPRTTVRKAVDMFVRATTLPSFTQTTCACLDICSALNFIQISTSVADERKCIFYYADIYRPYGDPGLKLSWDIETSRTSVRIAIGFREFEEFCTPGVRSPSPMLFVDEIMPMADLLTFNRKPTLLSDNTEPSVTTSTFFRPGTRELA